MAVSENQFMLIFYAQQKTNTTSWQHACDNTRPSMAAVTRSHGDTWHDTADTGSQPAMQITLSQCYNNTSTIRLSHEHKNLSCHTDCPIISPNQVENSTKYLGPIENPFKRVCNISLLEIVNDKWQNNQSIKIMMKVLSKLGTKCPLD